MGLGDLNSINRGSVMSTIHDACYENTILDLHELDLDRLYGGRYTSLAHFHLYGCPSAMRVYVARADGAATAVLPYRQQGRQIEVLNEGIRLAPDAIARFAAHMFAGHPEVSAIALRFIQTGAATALAPASQQVACGDDTVLTLASTARQYLDSLGSSTRATIKNRLNRLRREFPSFTLAVYEKDAVDPGQLRAIIALNRKRMKHLNKPCTIDAREEERIVQYVRARGFVTVATIDGQICAGAICYRFGQHFAARCLAHDPHYDAYRLGFLCAYLSIAECTKAAPGGQFNFGWGEYEYKYHLGGVRRALSTLVLYRSRHAMLCHPQLVLHTTFTGLAYRLRAWLSHAASLGRPVSGALILLARCIARWLKSTSRA